VLAIEAIRCPPRWPRHAVEERAGGGGRGYTPRRFTGCRGPGKAGEPAYPCVCEGFDEPAGGRLRIIMTVEDRFTLYARGGLRHTRLMDRDTVTITWEGEK